jgi:hypothetical protein
MSESNWLINSETGDLHPTLMKNIYALRAAVENPDLVLVAQRKDCENCDRGELYEVAVLCKDFKDEVDEEVPHYPKCGRWQPRREG